MHRLSLSCYNVTLVGLLTCNIAYCTKYQDEDQGKSEPRRVSTAGQSVELTFDVASVLFMLDLYPSSSYNFVEKQRRKKKKFFCESFLFVFIKLSRRVIHVDQSSARMRLLERFLMGSRKRDRVGRPKKSEENEKSFDWNNGSRETL